MRHFRAVFLVAGALSSLLLVSACTNTPIDSTIPITNPPETVQATIPQPSEESTPTAAPTADETLVRLQPYDDLSEVYDSLYMFDSASAFSLRQEQFDPESIYTYIFYSNAVFEGAEEAAAEVMEKGKNPGLGVRELHEQGITGKNVNVAIIDQNLLLDHPEFSDCIAAYYDSGCEQPEDEGSMHAPAVLSILAGKNTGVAPDAKVYFAASPSWKQDAAYMADCLHWIIAQNRELPEGEKIRLVSVSAAPEEGWYENSEQWDEAVAEAQQEGILVIDCRMQEDTGFVFASYCDPDFPEDATKCKPGFPSLEFDDPSNSFWSNTIFAPASYRTTAEEYYKGSYLYCYWGSGGQSWAVPYVAGVLALGWQVNPDLDAATMKDLLYQSCWINEYGNYMINPPAFIELVKETA